MKVRLFVLRDLLGSTPDEWRDRALCSEVDPELFFPPVGSPGTQAKRVCGRCEVRNECLQWALDTREPNGVAGGLGTKERRRILDDLGVPDAELGDMGDDEPDDTTPDGDAQLAAVA